MSKLKRFLNTTTVHLSIIMILLFIVQRFYMIFFADDGNEFFTSFFSVNIENYYNIYPIFLSIFTHGNIVHLFVNIIVLISFGIFVEKCFRSKKKYLIFFVAVGVIASVSQLIVMHHLGNTTGLVGASGSIAGIIGFLAIKAPKSKIYFLFFIPMKLRNGVILFALLSFGLVLYKGFLALNIAHTAHMMGLILGVSYAYFINNAKINIRTKKTTSYTSKLLSKMKRK